MFNHFFFQKSCRNVKNIVQPGRPQITQYSACSLHAGYLRLHKHTHTHTHTENM